MEMPEATARRMIEKLLLEEEHRLIILKRTVIYDQTAPDDWCVLLNGETVGRILPRVGNPQGTEQWQSFVTLPLASPDHGSVAMDKAKARWGSVRFTQSC